MLHGENNPTLVRDTPLSVMLAAYIVPDEPPPGEPSKFTPGTST
jgi:hypothetical protein